MKGTIYDDFTLLVDGKESFKEIIKCINEAKRHIEINMFIWRDDNIGNEIAKAVLDAANRGVRIEISVDRYGVVLEKAEENQKSFFHKDQWFIEKAKSAALKVIYPFNNVTKKARDEYSDLYNEIMNHENIIVDNLRFKADHSKYFVFDDEILIMGGINIEDKENGKDMEGREYQDYMIKLSGMEHVNAFRVKLIEKENIMDDYFFGLNKKEMGYEYFEMEDLYLNMIKQTKKELMITMAYFSCLDNFIKEILKAHKRGVRVSIMIPNSANFQDDTNKRTVRKLMKLSNNEINVYLSNKMVHTKMMITDNYISFGSTNITKKAFNQLDELNIFLKNIECKLKDKLVSSIEENYKSAKKVKTYKDIKYNRVLASLERFVI